MKILRDYFLIKPDQSFLNINIEGESFSVSDAYTPERRIPVFGSVVLIPDRISDFRKVQKKYEGKNDPYSKWMWRHYNDYNLEEWAWTENKISVGDRVMYSYQFALEPEDDTLFKIDGIDHLLIRYDYIYAVQKDDVLNMLHDFVMISQPDNMTGRGLGKIVFGPPKMIGTIAMYNPKKAIRNEYGSHRHYDGNGKSLYRLHKKDIIARAHTYELPDDYDPDKEIYIFRETWPCRLERKAGVNDLDIINSFLEYSQSKIVHLENATYQSIFSK